MKQKSIFISITIIFVMIISYAYNNFFTKSMIEGRYINRNYNNSSNNVEIPHVEDTLFLLKNNQFLSGFWGKGSYRIIYSVRGTEIELRYNYEFGKAGFRAFIKRMYFGKMKIILDSDQNHYYEKLN